jgi:hypothetical protein
MCPDGSSCPNSDVNSCPMCRCDDGSFCPNSQFDSCPVEQSTLDSSTGTASIDPSTGTVPSGTSTGTSTGVFSSAHMTEVPSLLMFSLLSMAIILIV